DWWRNGAWRTVLLVGPLLERMIVAVSADKPDPQEQLGGVLHLGVRLVGDQIVIRRGIIVGAASRGDQLVDELVVGLVLRYGFANPVAKAPQALLAQEFPVALQQVAPFERPVIDEFGT